MGIALAAPTLVVEIPATLFANSKASLSLRFIDKAYANDWDIVVELNKSNVKIDRLQENLNIIDKNVRVLEKIVDTAENNLTAVINNACKVKKN